MNEIEREDAKKIFGNLKIVHIKDNPQWKKELSKIIEGNIDLEDPEEIETRGLIPLENILKLLTEHMGCESIVIENEYVDEDYLQEYASFYSKVFGSPGSKTQRLHFFKNSELEYESLKNLSENEYLGFTVIRPTVCYRTSRTILKPPPSKDIETYLLCQSKFDVNLSGSKLTVEGPPFIQQDSNVGVCATAALWMCCLYMHQKYGFPRLHIPTIAKAATRYLLLGPPRVGLNTYQIMAALRDLGYQPLLLPSSLELVNETTQAIYSYVESEIPVILLLSTPRGGHAAAVVGHSYDVSADISSDSNIDLIDFFYIQDDALGPYRTLTRRSCHEESGDYSISGNVEAALILLPPEIVLDADNVTAITSEFIAERKINKLLEDRKGGEKLIVPERELAPLVFRAFLMRSNDFKGSTVIDEMDESLRLKYKAMRMPKYIWVVELSTKENIKSGKTAGHIILDSTADRHVSLESFLVINLCGRVVIRIPGQPLTSCELYFSEESPLYSQIRRRPVKNE